jgi:predicted O-methyltransferase YrrM
MIAAYLKFLIQSTNQHGIHSPFVFDLATKCFYDKKKYTEYQILEAHRKSLFQNKNFIEVTDFGAGSRVFKSNQRRVCQIAKNAGISQKRANLLFKIVRYFEPKSILEIGTSLGLATMSLFLGNKNAKLTTLEGCPNTILIAKKYIKEYGNQNIHFVTTEFSSYFKTHLNEQKFDLIYFDGNHSQKATLEYFNLLLPTATNNSVWIFDDIHWSEGMENAWDFIKNHPKVRVTIDTFGWGIVFFRAEQAKEHFVVRV